MGACPPLCRNAASAHYGIGATCLVALAFCLCCLALFSPFRLIAQVADQAENRMLAAQAVLLHCCGLRGLWHPLRRDSGDSSSQRSSAEFGRKVTFA
jgi:hypothetical protein